MTDRGLSLLELTAAMAIFALIAVISLQLLTSALLLERRVSEVEMRTADMAYALALLRRDLQHVVVPSRTLGPDGTARASVMLAGANGPFEASLGAEPILPLTQETGFARVAWSHDAAAETLIRAYRPIGGQTLADNASEAGVVILEGVTNLSIRVLAGDEWQTSLALGQADATGAGSAPVARAMDIRLTTRSFGDMRVVEALR